MLKMIFTLQQSQRFDEVINILKQHGIEAKWNHASNSSAVMRFNFPQYNMVRIGLAAYGLYCSESARKAMDLRLALTLVSRIVGINICKAGETISYGRSYRVERDKQKSLFCLSDILMAFIVIIAAKVTSLFAVKRRRWWEISVWIL